MKTDYESSKIFYKSGDGTVGEFGSVDCLVVCCV